MTGKSSDRSSQSPIIVSTMVTPVHRPDSSDVVPWNNFRIIFHF